tara:strand:- start:2283 stop:3470 length:1188 start_codon:yes stop_codon:yes gene_type:complete
MSNKIHVLVIPSYYPRFDGDYLGSFWREQALGLSKNNCKVGVIYPELESLRSKRKIRIFPKFDYYNDENIPTYRFLWTNWFIKLRGLQILAFQKLGMVLFKKYIKQHGLPDIIHCQSIFNAGFLGEHIFKRYKTLYVLNEVNSGFLYKNQNLETYYDDVIRIAGKSEKCFTVSSTYSKHLNTELSNNIEWEVHHNIVSDLFLKAKIQPYPKNKFIFISIARLHKVKNFPLIIKSFALFSKLISNSQLNIVGTGSELKNLKKLANDLQINDKINFLGRKDRADVVEEINKSSAMLHGCIYETFGVVLVESLALGRPVIAAKSPGAEDIITNKVGLTTENDEQKMCESMLYMYKNFNSYNINEIRDYCTLHFSEKELSIKLINHYSSILKEKKIEEL